MESEAAARTEADYVWEASWPQHKFHFHLRTSRHQRVSESQKTAWGWHLSALCMTTTRKAKESKEGRRTSEDSKASVQCIDKDECSAIVVWSLCIETGHADVNVFFGDIGFRFAPAFDAHREQQWFLRN